VNGTETKSKEMPISNVAGIMTYATVLSGSAIGTFAKTGFITAIRTINILRGKTNPYSVALVPGIMTAEQETAVNTTIAQAIADDKALIVAKKKARTAAKEATAAAKLIVEPVVEAIVVAAEPAAETGETPTV
jgi:CRISPR/Cas system-associated endonuclease Cas1